jgi:hypothetical protein
MNKHYKLLLIIDGGSRRMEPIQCPNLSLSLRFKFLFLFANWLKDTYEHKLIGGGGVWAS